MRYFALKNAFNLSFDFIKLMNISFGKFETLRTSKKWLEGRERKEEERGRPSGATGLQLLFSLGTIRKNKAPSPGVSVTSDLRQSKGFASPPSISSQEGPKGKDFENGEKHQERDILLFCLDAKMWHCEWSAGFLCSPKEKDDFKVKCIPFTY